MVRAYFELTEKAKGIPPSCWSWEELQKRMYAVKYQLENRFLVEHSELDKRFFLGEKKVFYAEQDIMKKIHEKEKELEGGVI